MHRSCASLIPLLALVTAIFTGCVLEDAEEGAAAMGTRAQSLAHAGGWQIPMDVRLAGDAHPQIDYVGAGPWVGESGCSGGMEPGTAALREYIYDWFPATHSIGGYNCRPIGGSSTMSLHGTGRALDIMIPLAGSWSDDNAADNDLGDPIGNWLIENADEIGIQFIIWDQWTWGAHRDPGQREASYGGPHPHHDHLHIELTVDAAAGLTPFFQGDNGPPELAKCAPIPAAGAIIDDVDPCVQLFGDPEFWRTEEGLGYGGSLRWTNAFSSTYESNWGRYILDFETGGDYEVFVYLEPERSVHRETRYAVTHATGVTEVTLDQSSGSGWTSLGWFQFAAGDHQDVMVFDNSPGKVEDQQHISVDALKLVGAEDDPGKTDGPGAFPADLEGEPESAAVVGGCAASGGPGGAGGTIALVGAMLVLGLRRRRC